MGTLSTSSEPLVALPWEATKEHELGRVIIEIPVRWKPGSGPPLAPVVFRSDPESQWTDRLRAECTHPVVLRWREQWRGECLSRSGTRIRGAVIRIDGEWRGVEARYSDSQDARLAPPTARILASLRPAR